MLLTTYEVLSAVYVISSKHSSVSLVLLQSGVQSFLLGPEYCHYEGLCTLAESTFRIFAHRYKYMSNFALK